MVENPIQQNEDQIIIDKKKVESISKRFLVAAKTFLMMVIGEEKWKRLGLEITWRYFLPIAIVIACWFFSYLSYWIAGIAVVIGAIWILRKD